MDSYNMPMKWHKFLIYFSLWANAVMSVISGAQIITGSQYGPPEAAGQLYATVSGLKAADMVFGVLLIAMGAFFIYTRFQLAGFKAGAPNKLTIAYALDLAITLGYLMVVSGLTKIPVGDLMNSSVPSTIIASVVLIIVNRVYYNKRAHLFGDGPSYAGSTPETTSYAPSSGTYTVNVCPKCGTKAEAGDAFCVNCGTKLMR